MRSLVKGLWAGWLLSCLAAASASALTAGGAIAGHITDTHGVSLYGVTVTVTDTATGFVWSVTTSGDGRFRFASLPPGSYQLTVRKQGYAEVIVRKAATELGVVRGIDVRMSPTAVEEQVTVTAPVRLIENAPDIGMVAGRDLLGEVPLRDRRPEELAVLAPFAGAVASRFVDGARSPDDLPLDAVDQIHVTTFQSPAEYGSSSGGVLLLRSRAGTNEWGGDAFASFRRPDQRWQWGVAGGGPIARDVAYWFAAVDGDSRSSERRRFAGGSAEVSGSHLVEGNYVGGGAMVRDLWIGRGSVANDFVIQRAHGANGIRESLAGSFPAGSAHNDWTIGGEAIEGKRHALFAEDVIISGKFATYAGLRYDSSSSIGWSPRLGVTYDVNGSGRNLVRAAFGRYRDRQSNDFSLGYSWQANPWVALNLDAVHADPQRGPVLDALAISGQARFSTLFMLAGSYSYTRTRADGKPRHRAAVAGTVRFAGGISLSGISQYRSSKTALEPVALTDLRLAKAFATERGQVDVMVDAFNVFNRRDTSAAGPRPRSGQIGVRARF